VTSSDARDAALDWAEECHEEHPQCSSVDELFYPSRLLEIPYASGKNFLKLFNTEEVEDILQYTALSYC
jgi:hypothetical protein